MADFELAEGTYTVTADAPATLAIHNSDYCTLHSDTSADDPQEAGMAATLVVE